MRKGQTIKEYGAELSEKYDIELKREWELYVLAKGEKVRKNSLTRTLVALGERDGWYCHYCQRPFAPIGRKQEFAVKFGVYIGTEKVEKKFYLVYKMPGSIADWPTVEHIIPKSRGGTNDLENLTLACWWCNNQRWIQDHDLFMHVLTYYAIPI